VAELLGTRVWWKHDGRSVFSAEARRRNRLWMSRRDFSRVISRSKADFERRRHALRLWRAGKYGTGAESELLFGDPWASAYRIGPHPELLGRAVPGSVAAAAGGRVHARLANAALLDDVEPSDQILPTRVTGRLPGTPRGAMRDLAVAVNGRIRAVGRSFHLDGRRMEFFSLIVPESALHPGRNRVQLFEVAADGSLARL
jgi:hypothetical protein